MSALILRAIDPQQMHCASQMQKCGQGMVAHAGDKMQPMVARMIQPEGTADEWLT